MNQSPANPRNAHSLFPVRRGEGRGEGRATKKSDVRSTPQPHCPSPQPSPRVRGEGAKRRGSVYLLVLGTAMLVTIVGVGALTVARVSARTMAASSDWEEAGVLAVSATE